jgi:thiol-disulfide isomerase/thioredoxin
MKMFFLKKILFLLPVLNLISEDIFAKNAQKKTISKKSKKKSMLKKPEPVRKADPLFHRTFLPISKEDSEKSETTPVSLAQLAKGRPVLLILWAPWCGPCIGEMPSVQKLYQSRPDLAVVPVSIDGTAEGELSLQNINTLPLYYTQNAEEFLQGKNITAVPTALLFDQYGQIVWIVTGKKDWSSDASVKEIFSKLRDKNN